MDINVLQKRRKIEDSAWLGWLDVLTARSNDYYVISSNPTLAIRNPQIVQYKQHMKKIVLNILF